MTVCGNCHRNVVVCECNTDQPKTEGLILMKMVDELRSIEEYMYDSIIEAEEEEDPEASRRESDVEDYIAKLKAERDQKMVAKYYELLRDNSIPEKIKLKFVEDRRVKDWMSGLLP